MYGFLLTLLVTAQETPFNIFHYQISSAIWVFGNCWRGCYFVFLLHTALHQATFLNRVWMNNLSVDCLADSSSFYPAFICKSNLKLSFFSSWLMVGCELKEMTDSYLVTCCFPSSSNRVICGDGVFSCGECGLKVTQDLGILILIPLYLCNCFWKDLSFVRVSGNPLFGRCI